MKMRLCWLIGLWISAAPVFAQSSAFQVRIQRLGSVRYNTVNDLAWNGWALQVERSHTAVNRFGWLAGVEAGYTGWGNQVLAKGGVLYSLTNSPRLASSVRLYAMPGAVLFRPQPLFTYRLGGEAVVAYKTGRRLGVLAVAGIAYSACPAYERYGRISRYVDVPLSIGVQWQPFGQ